MRRVKFIFSAFFILTLSSCSFDIILSKDTISENTKEYEIDVVETFVDCKRLKDYKLIEPVNVRMGQIIDSLTFDTKSQATSYFSSRKSRNRPAFKYQFTSRDTVFIATNKIISTRILAYTFTGGAHGMTRFYSINYSPEIGSFIKLEKLLDLSRKKDIDALIQKYFANENGAFNVAPTLDLASAVNVSKTAVIFTYEQYILGPYSSGYAVIEVPIKEMNGLLNI